MKKNKNIFIWFLLVVVLVAILLMPKIYEVIEKNKLPIVEDHEKEKEEEKIIDQETLDSLKYPIMRNSKYERNTYYSLDVFNISNMSNNDILYNAYMDIEEVVMDSLGKLGSCTNVSKQLDAKYIELRIKNILGKNIDYTLTNFYVPEDADNNYKGNWIYDSANSKYIYDGLCTSKVTNDTYYNLEQFIKAEYNKNDIIVYYYVGFAKITGDSYTIYSDAKMTDVLSSGTGTIEQVNSLFEEMDNKNKKIYKYIFKDNICSYNEYCLYEGKWINEL